MKIKNVVEYKLKGERNNRPRRPLIFSNKVFVIFVYDKKGFIESKIQCLNITDFALLWEYTHPHVINNLVLTKKGSLLASCMNGEVLNFETLDGAVLWRFKTSRGNIGPVSNEVDSKVVCSGVQGNQSTWCIDTTNGNEVWSITNNGHSYHPYVYGDKILNCIGNDLNCLDLNSGRTLWKTSEPKTYLFNPKVANNLAMAPGHGLINFYALENGKFLNSIQTGQSTKISESGIREIVADENSIYFGDAAGHFYSYSLPGSGNSYRTSLQWKIKTNGGIESTPAFFHDSILVINNGNQLLRIDKSNGEIKQEIKTKGKAFISGVTVEKEEIFYSCNGGFVAKCTV
jgi:outer membrane protein assembly factor BamB